MLLTTENEICLTLNNFALRELESVSRTLNCCTTLAQARGAVHEKIEEYEKANKELKAKL